MTAPHQVYTVGANAAVAVLNSDINNLVPGWAKGLIPAGEAQSLAGPLAVAIIDAVDAYRKTNPDPAST